TAEAQHLPPAASATPDTMPPLDPAALSALTEHLVHFEAAAPGSKLLSVNFAAAARQTDDAAAQRLLEPLLANLDTLSLSQCNVTDQTAALLANASHLRRLDLRATAVSDAGVAAIRHLTK